MRVAEQLRAGSASCARTTSLGWLRNPRVWLTVVISGLILLLSVAGLTNRLDPDEGAFLAIAQEILHGRVPYRDAFDQKSPAIYYLVASVLALGGRLGPLQQVLAMRGVALLADFMAAVGLFLLGRRWCRTEVGILAPALARRPRALRRRPVLHRAFRHVTDDLGGGRHRVAPRHSWRTLSRVSPGTWDAL